MCQHNERFDEWWAKQVDNGGTWTTLERLAAKDAWEAATRLAEEKFTSTNISSTEICEGTVCDYCKYNPCKWECRDYEMFIGRKLRTC